MSKRLPMLLGFFLVLFAVWLQTTPFPYVQNIIVRLENLAYDFQLRTKILTHHASLKTSVAIVDIDDKSLTKEGRWPWSRTKMAELLTQLQAMGAVVIALDITFPEKETNIAEQLIQVLEEKKLSDSDLVNTLKKISPYFENDLRFAQTLQKSDTVLGMSFLPRVYEAGQLPAAFYVLKTPQEKQLNFIIAKGYVSNIPLLENAAKSGGFLNVFPDVDGIVRRVPLVIRYQDSLYPSLALEAVKTFLLSDVKLITAMYNGVPKLEGIQVADHFIPTDELSRAIVPFQGKSFTYPYYSATDVLNKKIASEELAGKIIFIGTSGTGLGDLKTTAIESVYPGVEVQATIADGILNNRFSYKPAWGLGAEVSLTILLGLIFAFSFPYFGPRVLTLIIIALPVLLIAANNWLWQSTGLIISIFIPILLTFMLALLNMVYGYLFETRRRERLHEMFGQYVPPTHIDEMLKEGAASYGLYGEDRDMTVLFSDIRNFTTISESMSASQVKEMLNEFFTPMTEIIFKYRGTIDKYVGDLIMAFWGAPLKDKRHAQHAISAALEMQKKLEQDLEPLLLAHGWPEIHIGIGINSGLMTVGDMGSKFRRNYTVLGDAVNLASRIEGLTKFYGVRIIITQSTAEKQDKFIIRQLDRVRVKGKEEGIGIYEVIGTKEELTSELTQELEASQLALNYYFERNWEKAQEIFAALNKKHPEEKLYSVYLERLARFEKNPPPEDWQGIYTHVEKHFD